MRRPTALTLVLLTIAPWPALAATEAGDLQGRAADCDRLAADPIDPARKGPGVAFDDIDGAAAEAACRAAITEAPGEPRFTYQLGRALDRLERYSEARDLYERAFQRGYAIGAQAEGKLYELGLLGPADYTKAETFYWRALDAGFKAAAADLAYLFDEGLGHKENDAEAARLYTVAADAGDAYAKVNLGVLYETGSGVPKDVNKALVLYREAAELGDPAGAYNIGLLYSAGTDVPADYAEAMRRLLAASATGYPLADIEIGRLHAYGLGVTADLAEAERWWRKAIDTGDEEAMWQAENELAWNLARSGIRIDEAQELATSALEAVPDADKATVLDTAAWIDHLKGNNRAALVKALEVVRLAPDFAPYLDRLGDIHAALGDSTEALAAWRTALSLSPPDMIDEPTWDRAAVAKKLADAEGSAPQTRDAEKSTIRPVRPQGGTP